MADITYKICPRCDGDGWDDEYNGLECSYCAGTGEVEVIEVPRRRRASNTSS